MSGGSSTNSWTILTPEETVAETLRPLAEGTEHHDERFTSTAGHEPNNQSAEGAASAKGLPVEDHPVSEDKKEGLSKDLSTGPHTSLPPSDPDAPTPSSFEQVCRSSIPGSDTIGQSGAMPESPAQPSPNTDSFSDSYTHMAPFPGDPPASVLSAETLGGFEFTRQEGSLTQEGKLHLPYGEELQPEDESDLSRMTDLGKQADSPDDSEVVEEMAEKRGEESEPEVRRRRSLLTALERIGRMEEEEEEGEEEFQLPQREDDSGFSVNKCILGAVILLGLGTIFFSGVFMDLDEESDYGTRELKDSEVPGKQEWLNPEVPPPPVDADDSALLNEIVKGNQQISELQAQLQAQREELKVAKGQAAEGATERQQWEEENSRLKKEVASLPVLQKENEKMKRELESVPALKKELETLKTELKLSSASEAVQAPAIPTASPPSGQPEDSRQGTAAAPETQARKPRDEQKAEKVKDWKKDKHDKGEKKDWKERQKPEWKEGEKKERKDGGKTEWREKERKQGKHEQIKFDKDDKQKSRGNDKQWKEKDWKKEKASRGDEGKPWKDREGKKDWVEKSERKEWKEEKDWKKAKHEKENGHKQWRGNEENDRKRGKDHGERHKVKEEWKGEKEPKKVKDGFKESGKWEKKDWKEKGEKKEWKKDMEWRSKTGKEGKGTGERKHWEAGKRHGAEKGMDERRHGSESERKSQDGGHNKDRKSSDERKRWEKTGDEWKRKEKKHNGDREKESSGSHKGKDERKFSTERRHNDHLWGERKPPHTHRRPSMDQPEYWAQQRGRLQHHPKPPQPCQSLEACAEAEGLLPVALPQFEAVLHAYLARAQEAGVASSKTEELQKLATEFFRGGVFVHDQMSFQDFVEDVGDILEDMVEGEEEEEEEEQDSAIEEEMEGFEREVMKKFSVPGAAEKKRAKEEWKRESRRTQG